MPARSGRIGIGFRCSASMSNSLWAVFAQSSAGFENSLPIFGKIRIYSVAASWGLHKELQSSSNSTWRATPTIVAATACDGKT